MNKCGTTVTGIRTRYNCFLMQLKCMSIYIINALHIICPINPKTCIDIRKEIDIIMSGQSDIIQQVFISYLNKKVSTIHTIVREALSAYIELMGFDPMIVCTYTDEYIDDTVWLFFTRIVYERPRLLLPDTNNGDNIDIIRDSMEYYLSEQVKINKK